MTGQIWGEDLTEGLVADLRLQPMPLLMIPGFTPEGGGKSACCTVSGYLFRTTTHSTRLRPCCMVISTWHLQPDVHTAFGITAVVTAAPTHRQLTTAVSLLRDHLLLNSKYKYGACYMLNTRCMVFFCCSRTVQTLKALHFSARSCFSTATWRASLSKVEAAWAFCLSTWSSIFKFR